MDKHFCDIRNSHCLPYLESAKQLPPTIIIVDVGFRFPLSTSVARSANLLYLRTTEMTFAVKLLAVLLLLDPSDPRGLMFHVDNLLRQH